MAGFTAVGDAIHNDFFVVTGSGFADDLQLLFETAAGTVPVVPNVVRPHLTFVAQLPTSVPTGRHWLRLQYGGTTTEPIPVEVTARPPYTVRVLYSGKPKPSPYTIVFVANPAIQSQFGGSTFNADPVLTNRAGYHSAVAYCLQNILRETEGLLRAGGIDVEMRFVSVFDATLAAQEQNSLAHELPPNIMETRRDVLASFLVRFHETADMVFVLHGSTTHDRASAWFTTDDNSRPAVLTRLRFLKRIREVHANAVFEVLCRSTMRGNRRMSSSGKWNKDPNRHRERQLSLFLKNAYERSSSMMRPFRSLKA
jgi:hypothetical protein